MKKRLVSIAQILVFGLILTVSFNNCGQAGSLDLKETTSASNTDSQGDPIDTPTEPDLPPPTPSYSVKESFIDINEVSSKTVDILMVIDNSGSMAFEQKNMADRFDAFIDQLQGLDWRVAIITTDVSKNEALRDGRLIAFDGLKGKTFVDSSMNINDVKVTFANTIQRPETGSGYEQGVKATYRAIERSQSSDPVNLANKSFFRSSAALSIILVSDADETPKGYSTIKNDPRQLLAKIKTIWPQKSVSFHSIVVKSEDNTCLSVNENESYGKTYELAASLTNGIVGTVCAEDYGQQLQVIGQTTRDAVNTLTLHCKPVDANQDGQVDIEIIGPNGQRVLQGFHLSEAQVKFDNLLPVGRTTARYSCLM